MPNPAERAYTYGMAQVGDRTHAWLQPQGDWGYSNAGLIQGDGRSLLVDTLFDLQLTQAMLDGFAPLTEANPIDTLVNTHANPDHTYGNQLVAGAEIIATEACAAEFADAQPEMMELMTTTDLGDPVFNEFVARTFARFTYEGITLTPPTRTFTDRLSLDVAGTAVELVNVGPAHTDGDLLVHVPEAGVVYTGDILFIGGTPIAWAGPLDGWIAACDTILGFGCDTIVPGHGPVVGPEGPQAVKGYLAYVQREATARFEAGLSAEEAIADIDLGPYRAWDDSERIVVNVHTRYRELDPEHVAPPVPEMMRLMAHYAAGAGDHRTR
jgi:glyoxylase-like metal-dependent hydrolase (beta-lactamase superfamily II)